MKTFYRTELNYTIFHNLIKTYIYIYMLLVCYQNAKTKSSLETLNNLLTYTNLFIVICIV